MAGRSDVPAWVLCLAPLGCAREGLWEAAGLGEHAFPCHLPYKQTPSGHAQIREGSFPLTARVSSRVR